MDYYPTMKLHLIEILNGFCSTCALKTGVSAIAGTASYLVGVQNQLAVQSLVVLISFDLITALIAKKKLGEPIESRKALKTVTKLTIYGLFVSAAYLTETIIPGVTFLDSVALSYLAITELISIMENVGKMGYSMPQKLLNQLYELKNDK